MKKTPNIIDTYYKSLGTKIFRDTTALPFADGGPLNDRNIKGDLLPSVYASALGRYYGQGGMLKRADGSYSPRGLWDNIRANAGSGKEPTKEMLAQEKKINNNYAEGGVLGEEPPNWRRPNLSPERIAAIKALHGDTIFGNVNPNDLLLYDLNKDLVDNASNFTEFLDPTAQVSDNFAKNQTTQDIKTRMSRQGYGLDTKTGTYMRIPKEVLEMINQPEEDIIPIPPLLPEKIVLPKKDLIVNDYDKPEMPTYDAPGYYKEYPTLTWQHHNSNQLIPHVRPHITTVNLPTPISSLVQKVSGYNPSIMEGYEDEEGNSIVGEIGKAQEEGRRINFQGLNSLRDKQAQKEYNTAFDKYEDYQKIKQLYDQRGKNMFIPTKQNAEGGQLKPDYSLPEDSFQQGGRGLKNSVYASSMGQYPANYAEGGAMNQYPDGGAIYTYAKRPGSFYQKAADGSWMISNAGTNNQYVPIQDPTGQRAALLNQHATVYNAPVQGLPKPTPLTPTASTTTQVDQKIYPNKIPSETTQQVASKVMPQSKQQWQDYEFVKQNNAQRKSDLETLLITQGHTPEEAAQVVGSYGSNWVDLEAEKAREIQAMNSRAAAIQQGETPDTMQSFVPREEQSTLGKAKDVLFNPFTAAGYAVRGQEIPDYMGEKIDNGTLGHYANGQFVQGRSLLDTAVDSATPIGWGHSAYNIAERALNDKSGDFWTEENAWDALNVLPGIGLVAKGMKYMALPKRLKFVSKSIGTNLAVDAGSIIREPVYAPHRPSFLNLDVSQKNTEHYNPLSNPEIPQINPKTGLFQINNTTVLTSPMPGNFVKSKGPDFKSAESLPEYMHPYLYPKEVMDARIPEELKAYYAQKEASKTASKLLQRQGNNNTYYDLDGNIIKTPKDNY